MKRFVVIFIFIVLSILMFARMGIGGLEMVLQSAEIPYENLYNSRDCVVVKCNALDREKLIDILNISNVKIIDIGQSKILEGYSKKVGNSLCDNNNKINIQISFIDNYILIGVPLIKGSF